MRMEGKIVAVLLLVLLAGCRSIPGEGEKITLRGMVYDRSNRPVGNYTISVDGKPRGITDIGGRFTLEDVERGARVLAGQGQGYCSFNDMVEVVDSRQVLYIRVPTTVQMLEEALTHGRAGELEKSLACVEEVLAAAEGNREAVFCKAVLLHLAGRHQESLGILEALDEGTGEDLVEQLKKDCKEAVALSPEGGIHDKRKD